MLSSTRKESCPFGESEWIRSHPAWMTQPVCAGMPGSCHVASICAPSTSTLTAPALVVLALHVRVGEVLASKEHAESDAERSFETYRLSDASRVGAGASGMVQLPHTSLGRVVVKLMLEFDSACATLTTSEVMAAFAGSAAPDE